MLPVESKFCSQKIHWQSTTSIVLTLLHCTSLTSWITVSLKTTASWVPRVHRYNPSLPSTRLCALCMALWYVEWEVMTSPHLLGICGSELMLDMKVRPNTVGNCGLAERGKSSGYKCYGLFQTNDSAVSSLSEILLLGKTVLQIILLLGNISLKTLPESTGASGDWKRCFRYMTLSFL